MDWSMVDWIRFYRFDMFVAQHTATGLSRIVAR